MAALQVQLTDVCGALFRDGGISDCLLSVRGCNTITDTFVTHRIPENNC